MALPFLAVFALLLLQDAAPTVASMLAQGQQLLAAGRTQEAEALFEQATRGEPGNAVAWNLLGTSRHAQKHWREAVAAFERALAHLPDNAVILGNLGACRFELHDYERAGADFQRVLELAPEQSSPWVYLGRMAVARGEDAQAERCFAAAVAQPKSDPLAYFHQGLFLFQARRLDEAQQAFTRTTELAPAFAAGHLNLGLVLQRKGETAAAELHLQRFKNLNDVVTSDLRQRQRVVAHIKVAQAAMESGHLDAALAAALRARDEGPQMPIVHQLLAQVYGLQGNELERAAASARARELAGKAAGK